MKNDIPPACDFQIFMKINSESTWPGLIIIMFRALNVFHTLILFEFYVNFNCTLGILIKILISAVNNV